MMMKLEIRTSILCLAVAVAGLAVACDGGEAVTEDIETSTSPLQDGGSTEVDGSDDSNGPEEDAAADIEDEEILYPGNSCGGDDQCSTGLCYGLATPQGAFEAPKCQSICLGLNDFNRYCDSDDDCCKGRCCIDCGAREGLCVLD
jgi:hypothetical protein